MDVGQHSFHYNDSNSILLKLYVFFKYLCRNDKSKSIILTATSVLESRCFGDSKITGDGKK